MGDSESQATYRVKNIFATSSMISQRMNAYDLTVNPDLLLAEERKAIRIYQKFEKVKHIMASLCSKRDIHIQFKGTSYSAILGYPFFDILPFVLIDNAIKFAPEHQDITATFDESWVGLTVEVSSLGPVLEAGEEQDVFKKGYRGKHARLTGGGSGLGLFVAKLIAGYHEIDISVRSDDAQFEINSIAYAKFTVKLTFSKSIVQSR